MKTYNFTQPFTDLYISGDIHGEIRTLVFNLKRYGIIDAVIIVAGDCGIGFEKAGHYEHLYRKISKALDSANCMLLLVRGNHDDPSFFENELIDFPRMKSLPDYSLVQTASKNILCVGGAISLDRFDRLREIHNRQMKRKSEVNIYWENEFPVYNEQALSELTDAGTLIDMVVTHTAPSFCYPHTKRNFDRRVVTDKQLTDDVRQERAVMDAVYNRLVSDKHPLRNWLYGHFHASHTEIIAGTCFSLLNIDELKKIE